MTVPPDVTARLDAVERRLRDHAAAPAPPGLTAPDPPTGERWEAAQVWAHLGEFVPYWLDQVRLVVGAASDEAVPFGRVKSDPQRVAAIERDRTLAPPVLMERIAGQIDAARALLGSLDAAAQSRRGVHPTLGVMDVDAIVDEFVVGHLEQHADQLDALRTAATD